MKDSENYNCIVKLEDGSTYKIFANMLHNDKLDMWDGWLCDAGKTRISIDANGDVYSGECRSKLLGNTKTGWELSDNSMICPKERCTGCTDDLMVKKRKK